jgi:hypothetical protein
MESALNRENIRSDTLHRTPHDSLREEVNMEKLSELISKYPLLIVGAILVLISAIGLVPLGEKSYPISEPRQWIPLALGVVLIGVYLIGYLRETNKPRHSLDRVTGGINRPAANTRITRAMDAEGWVKDMKKEQHLWLVVEVGTHKWPKADPIRTDKDGGWRRTIFEDGLGTVFSLSLYVADAEGHDKIQKWLDIGGLIGYHPFEVEIPGTRRLARIENLQK